MNITPMQIRAGRALLGWTQKQLAEATGLASATILSIENKTSNMSDSSAELIFKALTDGGVHFIGNTGVSLAEADFKVYEGKEGFKAFYDELYEVLKVNGGIVRISGVDENQFAAHLDEKFTNNHIERVKKLDAIVVKAIISDGIKNTKLPYVSYKVMQSAFFTSIPTYIHGDMIAHILWEPELKVICIFNKDLAKAHALQFELIWEKL
jgi:transcriptional regulator with XRE-family HTH domain